MSILVQEKDFNLSDELKLLKTGDGNAGAMGQLREKQFRGPSKECQRILVRLPRIGHEICARTN